MHKRNRLQRTALTAILIAALSIAIGAIFGAAQSGSAAGGTAPKNTAEPSISGTAKVGQTLTADPGQWTGTTPINYAYQWRRCDKTGNNCGGISGANQKLYDVKAEDVGHTLRVHVTAKNSAGSDSATSNATAVVVGFGNPKPPPTPATGCPAGNGPVSASDLTPPARLVIDGWTSSPSVLGKQVGTLTIRVHVSACGGRSVGNALVYAAAVPFNQFQVAGEQQTGSDGWATVNEAQQGGYPANPGRQQLLAVFLRARKAGDNVLGGITGSRLVSFKVNLNQ
jgi:hypothetical protein